MSVETEAQMSKCSNCRGSGMQTYSASTYSEYFGFVPPFCTCELGKEKRSEWESSEIAAMQREKLLKEKRDRTFRLCRIGRRFEESDISNLKDQLAVLANGYVDSWPEMKRKGRGLYFWGNVGSGKTYTAVAIAKAVMDQHITETMYFSFTDLMARVRSSYHDDDNNENLLYRACTCELLVIDDLGLEKATEWVAEQLYVIVNSRYEAMLPMIITSNQSPEDLAAMHNAQISSRILEMCQTVKFSGADRRTADRTLFPNP